MAYNNNNNEEKPSSVVAYYLVTLNLCMSIVLLSIGAWAINEAIDHGFIIAEGLELPALFSPISFPMGNAATGFFVTLSMIAGVVGVASGITEISLIRRGKNPESAAAASTAASIAFTLTALAMGFAWKEIQLNVRNAKLKTMEAFTIILTVTQLIYIVTLQI
ncbi:unnamed protein product [Cuscuta campestris]|uniref:AWPM-19-like family protein n=1 Tax=Cuscuta campestris TaxID=132261 RepID=A0A484MHZ4_9ASTE|nr:unnamed protein product [Cuscuta campestris]